MNKTEAESALGAIDDLRAKAEVAAQDYQDECVALADQVSEFMDSHSDKWQTSAAGEAWDALQIELNTVDFDISEVPELEL